MIPPAADERLIRSVGNPWLWLLFALPFSIPLWLRVAGAGSAGEVAALVAYIGVYLAGYSWAAHQALRWRVLFCAAAVALATLLVVRYDPEPMFYAHALALIAITLPLLWAALGSGVLLSVVLVVDGLARGHVGFELMMLLTVVFTSLGVGGFWRLSQRVKAANARLAELAVLEDRERLMRDLHDALGSTLTTLTVKAGLAGQLLAAGASERAATEMSDVADLGRRALADVRAAVSAGHPLSLSTALADARATLTAAGITPDLPASPAPIPPPSEGVFAHVLTEGVTNVVRHSGASRCEVRLGSHFIEVLDDGGPPAKEPGTGTGLNGLATRVAAIGGHLEAGPLPGRGFRLRAETPEPA
ncbi:histidine kinase [Nonomuraea sp. NPDC046570]|uniref:sensor histidine kinase n=1 Tax=Nonomuraea sp. NPDC046570 TaxID=3155255 RepID=UPI0033BFC975